MAQVDGLAQGFGELFARGAAGQVSLDFAAGVGRKLEIEILREQGEDFLAPLVVLVFRRFHDFLRGRFLPCALSAG